MARQTLLIPLPGQEMVSKRLNILRQKMLERITGPDVETILDDVIKRAKDGDQRAAEFVLTKLVGMGQQPLVQKVVVTESEPPAIGNRNGSAEDGE